MTNTGILIITIGVIIVTIIICITNFFCNHYDDWKSDSDSSSWSSNDWDSGYTDWNSDW